MYISCCFDVSPCRHLLLRFSLWGSRLWHEAVVVICLISHNSQTLIYTGRQKTRSFNWMNGRPAGSQWEAGPLTDDLYWNKVVCGVVLENTVECRGGIREGKTSRLFFNFFLKYLYIHFKHGCAQKRYMCFTLSLLLRIDPLGGSLSITVAWLAYVVVVLL